MSLWRLVQGGRAGALAAVGSATLFGGFAYCDEQAGATLKARTTTVVTFGLNLIGQLGNGHDRPIAKPAQVAGLSNRDIVTIALGDNASAAISQEGELYTWGSGAYGRLGHGDESSLNLPRMNDYLRGTQIVDVKLGGFHMLALDQDGRVHTWGRGTAAGHGSYEPVLVPTVLEGDIQKVKIRAIAAGRLHCAAVGEDGSVWTWGNNYEGELGHGDKKTRYAPEKVKSLEGKMAVDVACGRDFTVVLLEGGSLLTCGADDYGQLGQGRGHGERYVQTPRRVIGGLSDVAYISAGDYHSCALTTGGAAYTWGMGREGQLGHGEKTDQAIPKLVDALQGTQLSQVGCGGGHTGAVTSTGNLYLWGRGRDGQLGRGGELESIAAYRMTPQRVISLPEGSVLQVSLGADHSAALIRGDA